MTPVFNFTGCGDSLSPTFERIIDPFDASSTFGLLHNEKALLLHYGSLFATTTLIHYVERISEQLIYRYDKIFEGKVIDAHNNEHHVSLKYHVRPMGVKLEYDWFRLEKDLLENHILLKHEDGRTRVLICEICRLVDFWLERLSVDKFYFLTDSTRNWVLTKYDELQRPFLISDFE